MPSGIEVYNADGTLQFDTGNRLFRTLGSVALGTANGSASFSKNAADTSVFVSIETTGLPPPNVTIGSNSVSWDYGDIPTTVRGTGRVKILAY